MVYSESLARRIQQLLAQTKNIERKKMFGGIGFMLSGNICVGVWNDSLIARVGPEHYVESLQKPYAGEFDITGRAMKGWVLVAPDGIENDGQLLDWIQMCVAYVRTMPPK